jgi:hypothetical protein
MPPPPPSDSSGSSEPWSDGAGGTLASQSTPSTSHSKDVDDRFQRLEESIAEIRKLLPAGGIPSRPEPLQNDNTILSASSSRVEKRTHDHFAQVDGLTDISGPLTRFKRNDRISMSPGKDASMPGTFHFQPMQWADRVQMLDEDLVATETPIRLKNCLRGICHLPSPDDGRSLLNEYLHDFNGQIPLFHPDSIYAIMRDCYSGAADKTPLYWVLIYACFGIGHRMRAMSILAAPDDTSNADWYLNKCLAVLPDLLLEEPSLLLAQALLGVALLLQSSPRSHKAALFVSTAMHMAQDLGYNEATVGQDGMSPDDQQGFYVFWIAFFIDTTISLRAGRQSIQKLADISVPLPIVGSLDWIGSKIDDTVTTCRKANAFALRTSLALIQAEALEELFSVKARQRQDMLKTGKFNDILAKLKSWRQISSLNRTNVPDMASSLYQSDIAHVIVLEASYFETLFHLHAANALGAFTNRMDVFSPGQLRAAAELISIDIYTDAQRLLAFHALTPPGIVSVTW